MKKLWNLNIIYVLCLIVIALNTVGMAFYNTLWFIISAVVFCALLGIIIHRVKNEHNHYSKLFKSINQELSNASSNVMENFTIPLIVVSHNGEMVWYNKAFCNNVDSDAEELIGRNVDMFLTEQQQLFLKNGKKVEVNYKDKIFRVFESISFSGDIEQRVICFVDITMLQKYAIEYSLSRPVVALLAVDNFDEISKDLKDSERYSLNGKIQTVFENWFSVTGGIEKKLSGDRFMFVFESRYLNHFKNDKFSVLEEVKKIETPNHIKPTISIGIGVNGEGYNINEEYARQALDMALGRGGDQVAIKSDSNEFLFYGGNSNSYEKRSRVRTRIMASALLELIASSESVVLMGHKYSDLDCVGAAYALQRNIRKMGKDAYTLIDTETTVAGPFFNHVRNEEKPFDLQDPQKIISLINKDTLLIVLDTHRPSFVDFPKALEKARKTVVIDHHRKAVDYISDTVLFYHDASASSTCEMVCELLEYFGKGGMERTEAEGLLAGIMLDTRNFVFNTGIHTFEASAVLRKYGADPVEIKKLFADSIESYKIKSGIISSAEIYKASAIAINTYEGTGTKIITSQAADSLLEIKDVASSYVICKIEGKVNISARSLNKNVQIVMEKLGGGGGKTMAACQLDTDSFEKAKEMLIKAIDETEE